MTNTKGQWNEIRGCFVDESDYFIKEGTLYVTIQAGVITDITTNETLSFTVYGSDAPVIGNGCWHFDPWGKDIKRLGLVPQQIKENA